MVDDKIFVSVLMSVYAEEPATLKEAIDSILNQTFSNLEFFVYLDKPDNDELWAFLQECAAKDERLIIHRNEKNRFLAGTLNDELKLAKGDYIVRMDGDDISVPYRIEHLVNYMEAHPKVGVASSWMQEFGHKKRRDNRVVKYEDDFEKMKVNYLCQTPIAHAPCIIRRSVIQQYGPTLYNERCSKTQDYELWSRLMQSGVILGMVNEPLYLRRKTQGAGPNPIKYQIIHNQIARKNMKLVLEQVGIELPDKVSEDLIAPIHSAIKSSTGLLKNQLKMIQCILYGNVYDNSFKRIVSMLFNGDLSCLSVLTSRLKAYFCFVGKLTDMDNLVTSSDQIIYADTSTI